MKKQIPEHNLPEISFARRTFLFKGAHFDFMSKCLFLSIEFNFFELGTVHIQYQSVALQDTYMVGGHLHVEGYVYVRSRTKARKMY